MIICFSGTGNSRHLADLIQEEIGDEIVRFSPGLFTDPKKIKLRVKDERVVWVMPVHCWGLPWVARDIINMADIKFAPDCRQYLMLTCGDDIGYADLQWRRLLTKRGWDARGAYSVQMPNNYVFMKGFDIDSPELQEQKLAKARERVKEIVKRAMADNYDVSVVRGKYPWIKSHVIYPWFMWQMTKTKPFHATADCNSCGKCARVCPMMAIKLESGRPAWVKEKCISCTRCYHACPNHAIAYGKATRGKGQYMCPGYLIK